MMSEPQRIDREELAALARKARGTRSQAEVARELGVTQAAISKAETDSEAHLDRLRIRIVERYTDYRVEEPKAQYIVRGGRPLDNIT